MAPSAHPTLRHWEEHLGGGQGPSINLTRGVAARRIFRVFPRRDGSIHLQTSMPSLGFKSRPNVSITNHFSGWAALRY
ncbi:hypothetical protein TNCV_488851 [Trichonephila clavipes]|nr:hypothetical protein TNCV_488851 [Trichonephila clavipes]